MSLTAAPKSPALWMSLIASLSAVCSFLIPQRTSNQASASLDPDLSPSTFLRGHTMACRCNHNRFLERSQGEERDASGWMSMTRYLQGLVLLQWSLRLLQLGWSASGRPIVFVTGLVDTYSEGLC